jgi:predicted nucleic acid-binding protein
MIPSETETLLDEALRLLRRYASGEVGFVVPDIFWAEVANVMWKGFRQQRWSQSFAEQAVADLKGREFFTVSCRSLLPEALSIALAHNRSVYDSLYVALAIRSKTQMITADERLANALAASLPVKWLGAFGIE